MTSTREEAFDLLDNYDGTETQQARLIHLLSVGIEHDRRSEWDRAYRKHLEERREDYDEERKSHYRGLMG